ncbi:bifunctional fucokinase/fucose-1-phosphate guanylyltransferase [Phocaeicola sp.]|uniref:bifunctional fucokinase/fucose-1-phosphate guanylyltransferase n=1 Tax=Phocaeicola sp. TaxID=2773926 RepID=UPI0023D29231|nr:bifunctional fucokinase/fucose-1-phosphate guanylyltransferase [Phocaeicola sp.]MDE5678319.1 bifunctional fucokinase/L-fucose-1-P-guanylyltransferase [Phocaeicola sp.]
MKKLLSLPPNLVECFHDIENADRTEWFCTSDPIGSKLGSGGGTAWLLEACRQEADPDCDFLVWLGREKRILLHAGGQSRRLPGYAPSGKILTPIPIFRWARGQRLSQNLLSLQLPLYERIMENAPASLHTLVASGDVYIRASRSLQVIPEADVVCYGLWVDPNLAKNHGVFVSSRANPDKLDFMLQKPSVEELAELAQTHLFLMDIGIWLLSDRAVDLLVKRSHKEGKLSYYDMYSDFGLTLGEHPRLVDDELNALSVAILPLPGGEFYHYGTSRELISSTLAVQNLVNDQREIMHRKVKPHPAMFVQNAEVGYKLTAQNSEIWIENSCVGSEWTIHKQTIVTGVPDNHWKLDVPSGVCIDVVPFGESDYVARPYGFNDAFKGVLSEEKTCYQGMSVREWCVARGLSVEEIENGYDLQAARLFPICSSVDELGVVMRWMVSEPTLQQGKEIWRRCRKLSADEISAYANLHRLTKQREAFRIKNWPALAHNYERSVFYQLNLEHAAGDFACHDLSLPAPLPQSASLMTRISDNMFRARAQQLKGLAYKDYEDEAFRLMRDGLTASALAQKQQPYLSIYSDQIVWGRSPVRIDLAGGWTDTPPYCLNEGGNVVNIAIELNGQPPLQVYVKPCREYKVILRSIDLGAMETVSTYEEVRNFMQVGSPFSIPKAALVLAGFQPGFSVDLYASLEEQLKAFGSGLEITLLSAIPAGSGLGTSSILASTVLGAIADFCGLNWDKNEICNRTLILEQLLTTGGGWQDQYGGVFRGVKLLQTHAGLDQNPLVRWLPDYLFTASEYQKCHLLYYTGITRTAKGILAEIVRGMFLNSTSHLSILDNMKEHALDLYEAIQRGNFEKMGRMVGKTWKQNQALDPGTNPDAVKAIIHKIDDYCLGYKLPGAGGGGYLYMVAKDPEAAIRIRSILTQNPSNSCARFVDMTLSDKGLQISRS